MDMNNIAPIKDSSSCFSLVEEGPQNKPDCAFIGILDNIVS
jgi:hypothetical protein